MSVAKFEGSKLQRLQVELTSQQIAALQKLMTVCGIETRKDLISNALTLFEWAVEEVQRGNDVVSLNKDAKRYEVLRMPALMHAVKFAEEHRNSSIADQPAQRRTRLDIVPSH